ncbi:MAG: transposase [Tabrizicola sp.]|nr:transposase [Tabrizicola sp.]
MPIQLLSVGAAMSLRKFKRLRWAAMLVVGWHPPYACWTLPEGDADYSVRWKEIKTRFTKSVGQTGQRSASKIAKGERGLWQRRFWEHHLRNDRDFAAHLRYCWWNPVKHGLVDRAVDWPYSSIHRDIRLGQCDPEWTGADIKGDFGE